LKALYDNIIFKEIVDDDYEEIMTSVKGVTATNLLKCYYKYELFKNQNYDTVIWVDGDIIFNESIEELFENAKNLFYQKYERGRGIRLLGVGFHNIQNGIDDPQGELFDFGEKKKQAIEKTILELKQKNPKIPIKKARLID
jgi:alpha-N-acetylglucosamine transferase